MKTAKIPNPPLDQVYNRDPAVGAFPAPWLVPLAAPGGGKSDCKVAAEVETTGGWLVSDWFRPALPSGGARTHKPLFLSLNPWNACEGAFLPKN